MTHYLQLEQYAKDRVHERTAAADQYRTARRARRATATPPCGHRATAAVVDTETDPVATPTRTPALVG